MRIPLFNGGLNTRVSPILIESNQATEIENVDTSEGVLKSVKDTTVTTIQSDSDKIPYYYDNQDEWQNRADVTGYIEYQGKLYWTTDTVPYKYDGTDTELLGIDNPSSQPTVVVTSLPDPGQPGTPTITTSTFEFTITLAAAGGGAGPAGAYQSTAVAFRDGLAFDSKADTVIIAATESIDCTITQTAGTADYAIDTAIRGSQLLEVGDYLYLFGGEIAAGETNKIYSANKTSFKTWTEETDTLPGVLAYSQAIEIGGFLYLFGGENAGGVTDDIYRADSDDPTTWTDVGSLHTAVKGSQVLVVGTKVYLFGGYVAAGASNKIWSADTSDPLTWSEETNTLPGALYDSQIIQVGTDIYLLGGNDGAETDVIYESTTTDPTTWADNSNTLPGVLSQSQVISWDDNLYLLGGVGSDVIYTATEAAPTTWTDTTVTLPGALYNSQAIVMGDYAYLFGGYIAALSSAIYRAHIDTPKDWVEKQNKIKVYTTSATDTITTYTPAGTETNLVDSVPTGMEIIVDESIVLAVSILLGSRISVPEDVTTSKEADDIIQVNTTRNTGEKLVYYAKLGNVYYEFYRGIDTLVEYPAKINLITANTWVAGGLSGLYQYGYTYYNSNDGTESQLSSLSSQVSPVNDSVTLSNFVSPTNSQVTEYKIYRIGEQLTKFTLVAEIAISNTTYVDTEEDSLILGNSLYVSQLNGYPPSGLKYLQQVFGIFCGAVGDKFYFTRDVGNPNYWPETYYINMFEDITGIGISGDGIVVCTYYKTFLISGTGAATFLKHQISGNQGCVNHATIAEFQDGLLFVSTDGICYENLGSVKVVSKAQLGKVTLDTVNAVVHDEVYYIQLTSGKILAYDFRYEIPSLKYFDFDTNYLIVVDDILYGRKADGFLHTLFTGSEVSHKYKTGKITDGLVSERKLYDTLYIHAEGQNTMTVYIDGSQVLSVALAEGVNERKVPQAYSRGSYIEFYFTGTGTINEIDYQPTGRLNEEGV